jgi:hypothetical protein
LIKADGHFDRITEALIAGNYAAIATDKCGVLGAPEVKEHGDGVSTQVLNLRPQGGRLK